MKRIILSIALLALCVLLAGCGAGSYGANIPPAPLNSGPPVAAQAATPSNSPQAATQPTGESALPTSTQVPGSDLIPTALSSPTSSNGNSLTPTFSSTSTSSNPNRISFAPGATSYTLVADLAADVPQTYTLDAQAGQALYLELNGPFSVQVLDPQGNALTGMNSQGGPWSIGLNTTGTYSLKLAGNGHAVLTLYIPSPDRAQTVVPALAASRRVAFAANATSTTVNLTLAQGAPQGLILNSGYGRQLYISTVGDATVALIDPTGLVPPPVYSPGHWQFALGTPGDYIVELVGVGQVSITMTIPAVSIPPTPVPTVPVPRPTIGPPPGGEITITLANRGQTITLPVGATFLLALGEGYDWTVTVDNPAVVSRVVNIMVVRGAQGVYQANAPGRAILTATGNPACRQVQPPCMMPSIEFELTIIVQ